MCFFSRKKWSRMAKLRASPLARSWTACGSCVSWSQGTTRARTVWLSSSPRPAWPRRRRRPHRFSAHRTATHLPLLTTTMPQPLAAAAAQRRRPTSWRAGRKCEHSANRRQRQQHLQRQEYAAAQLRLVRHQRLVEHLQAHRWVLNVLSIIVWRRAAHRGRWWRHRRRRSRRLLTCVFLILLVCLNKNEKEQQLQFDRAQFYSHSSLVVCFVFSWFSFEQAGNKTHVKNLITHESILFNCNKWKIYIISNL